MATLGILDYIVLIGVMLVSLSIGIFFARKKQDSNDYTSGGGQMGILPVSLSLTVSYVSAITIQGTPAEVYMYGPEYMFSKLAFWGFFLCIFTYIPLYFRLNVQSTFEYLELRYKHKGPRIAGYIFGILTPMFYMGIASFGPAAAFESVTGIPTWINILVMMGICTIYTSIGGIKAVIWTDVFQAGVMLLGVISIIVVGTLKLENTTVWAELQKRSRLDFHVLPDPRYRASIWIWVVGQPFFWFYVSSAQPSLMRFKSVGTEARATKMVVLASVGFVVIMALSSVSGLVVYAYYSSKGCGPMASGAIYSSNQVISYFVVDVLNFPGMAGLFIAALVAATFSSISSAQNAISAILWYDVLQPYLGDVNDVTKTLIMKISVVVFGLLSTAVAFMSKVIGGSLAQITATILSCMGGPSFGLFVIGGLFPFVGGIAAMLGAFCSAIVFAWLAVGSVLYGNNWEKPILISEGCPVVNDTLFNTTDIAITSSSNIREEQPDDLWKEFYSISPFLYMLLSLILTVVIALLLSIIPALRQSDVDRNTLFPFVARLMPQAPTAPIPYTSTEFTDNPLPYKSSEYSNNLMLKTNTEFTDDIWIKRTDFVKEKYTTEEKYLISKNENSHTSGL